MHGSLIQWLDTPHYQWHWRAMLIWRWCRPTGECVVLCVCSGDVCHFSLMPLFRIFRYESLLFRWLIRSNGFWDFRSFLFLFCACSLRVHRGMCLNVLCPTSVILCCSPPILESDVLLAVTYPLNLLDHCTSRSFLPGFSVQLSTTFRTITSPEVNWRLAPDVANCLANPGLNLIMN